MNSTLRALKAVADPNRLRIVSVLREGPFAVAELTDVLGVGQSTVSRSLRILSDAGLVTSRRAGTWAWYSLASSRAEFESGLLDLLHESAPSLNGDREAVERVLARRRHATSEFFRRTAPTWDSVREDVLGPVSRLDEMADRVGEAGTVVDLGTGTGLLLERVAPRVTRVIGVDASLEMLELARRRVDEQALENTELRLGTLEHLPLGDGEANVMVANMVLHHVADVPSVLREIRRGLEPGGRLVIAELEECEHETFWQALGAQWPGFRPSELAGWLAEAGFEDVQLERESATDNEPIPNVFWVEARRAS